MYFNASHFVSPSYVFYVKYKSVGREQQLKLWWRQTDIKKKEQVPLNYTWVTFPSSECDEGEIKALVLTQLGPNVLLFSKCFFHTVLKKTLSVVSACCSGSDAARLLFVIQGQLLGCRGADEARERDSADRPDVAPEEFKRQENKQAFWSQRAHSLPLTLPASLFLSLPPSLTPLPLHLASVVSPQLSSPDLYAFFFLSLSLF